ILNVDFLERTNHRPMSKLPTPVLAAEDVRGESVLGDRHPKLRDASVGVVRPRLDPDSEEIARELAGCAADPYGDLGASRRPRHCLTTVRETTAAEFAPPGDDHVRRVNPTATEGVAILVLTKTEGSRREGILPPEPIPVVHVLLESDHLGAGNRLFGRQG